MSQPRRIPPVSERAFQRRYMHAWNVCGAIAVTCGLIFGPRLHAWSHSSSWLCGVMAIALYAGSVLLCPVVLIRLWRKPHATSTVLSFSIPIGAAGLLLVYLMRRAGPTLLYIELRQQYGLYSAVGLLYGASLIWAIAVALRRRQLGNFDVEDYG